MSSMLEDIFRTIVFAEKLSRAVDGEDVEWDTRNSKVKIAVKVSCSSNAFAVLTVSERQLDYLSDELRRGSFFDEIPWDEASIEFYQGSRNEVRDAFGSWGWDTATLTIPRGTKLHSTRKRVHSFGDSVHWEAHIPGHFGARTESVKLSDLRRMVRATVSAR